MSLLLCITHEWNKSACRTNVDLDCRFKFEISFIDMVWKIGIIKPSEPSV